MHLGEPAYQHTPGNPADRYAGWLAVTRATQEEWYSKVSDAATVMVRRWYEAKLSTYDPYYQAYLRRSLSPWGSLPRYIRVGRTAACAALRFKRPALRTHIPGDLPCPPAPTASLRPPSLVLTCWSAPVGLHPTWGHPRTCQLRPPGGLQLRRV
jgi:hypothetical protein